MSPVYNLKYTNWKAELFSILIDGDFNLQYWSVRKQDIQKTIDK